MKVSVAAIVMPLSRRGLVNEQKSLPPYSSPLFFKIVYVELHESIKEPQSNDDSVTDDMLIPVLQKF